MKKITDIRKIQLVELEILDEIVRICNKHNLDYFLVGGTCLGAVKYKGFIPWDDDIDIAMLREDYEKFMKIAINEIDDKYFVQCALTDSKYYLGFMKIRKNNTTFVTEIEGKGEDFSHQGFSIDIFPLDYTDNIDSLSVRFNVTLAKNLTQTMIYKRGYKKFRELMHPLISLLGMPFNIKTLQKMVNKLMQKHNRRQHNYICSFAGAYHYKKDSFPYDKVIPYSMVEFEGNMYKTFSDPIWYIIHLYGKNYKEDPKEEDRITHNPIEISFTSGKRYNSKDMHEKNGGIRE